MAASRPSRLGWIAGMFLGQRLRWAFGASSCTTITVSGAGALDGTYEKGSTTGDPFVRAGGTTFYEIYQFISSDIGGWYIAVGNAVVYRVYDPAVHPADVTLNWVECDGIYDCAAAPAVLQPVITCEGETVAPTPSGGIETPSPSPGPSPGPSPPPTAAATEADVTCGSDYACAMATDTVLADAVCSTDPCSDTDCCEPGDTVTATPSPIDSGSEEDGESPSPSPPPTTADADTEGDAIAPTPSPTSLGPSPPTTADAETDVTPAPVATDAESGPISASEGGGDDNGGDSTTELIIGVLSTLISTAIVGAVGLMCRRNRATSH